ncbi:MAG: hypothetical protein QM705_12725 [Ancrocorticia sp.]
MPMNSTAELAERFDNAVTRALELLARRRPLFHSEADFQFEFAWELRSTLPDCEIRLERPVLIPDGRTLYVDIMLGLAGLWFAVELKYIKAGLVTEFNGEDYVLKTQGAQDLSRYGILKDMFRIESLVAAGIAVGGCSLTLSNDPSLWKEPATPYMGAQVSNDDAFRVHEGRVISGALDWCQPAQPGTSHPPSGFHLTGTYTSRWRDYSSLPQHRNADFRYLKLASAFDE